MRKLKVRYERLPFIGERFELLAASGLSVRVVSHRSGRRDLSIGSPDVATPDVTVALTSPEATALAALLIGAHIELITERQD
jgi:hypothetical protein